MKKWSGNEPVEEIIRDIKLAIDLHLKNASTKKEALEVYEKFLNDAAANDKWLTLNREHLAQYINSLGYKGGQRYQVQLSSICRTDGEIKPLYVGDKKNEKDYCKFNMHFYAFLCVLAGQNTEIGISALVRATEKRLVLPPRIASVFQYGDESTLENIFREAFMSIGSPWLSSSDISKMIREGIHIQVVNSIIKTKIIKPLYSSMIHSDEFEDITSYSFNLTSSLEDAIERACYPLSSCKEPVISLHTPSRISLMKAAKRIELNACEIMINENCAAIAMREIFSKIETLLGNSRYYFNTAPSGANSHSHSADLDIIPYPNEDNCSETSEDFPNTEMDSSGEYAIDYPANHAHLDDDPHAPISNMSNMSNTIDIIYCAAWEYFVKTRVYLELYRRSEKRSEKIIFSLYKTDEHPEYKHQKKR